ncbi:uncharacterized protein UHOD_11881 [Ustilago sp. UG-2017b]|nr:uncharacterized protein UHOD_11881 [Ustilago sp. UG-2017b]
MSPSTLFAVRASLFDTPLQQSYSHTKISSQAARHCFDDDCLGSRARLSVKSLIPDSKAQIAFPSQTSLSTAVSKVRGF